MRRSVGAGYELDDDPARLDVDAVHRFLAEDSYWAKGREPDVTRAVVASAARVVGLYDATGAHLRWLLGTRDAHTLYRRFGFTVPSDRILERPPAAPVPS